MSNFLDNLKKSVDEGTFNSEAANKLKEIDVLADGLSETKTSEELEKSIEEKIIAGGVKTLVDGDEVAKLNSEYEEKMKERAKEEIRLATIVTLKNDDYDVSRAIGELKEFIGKQHATYSREDEENADLYEYIDKLVEKYDFKFD